MAHGLACGPLVTHTGRLRKVLVANRGEIAVRAFRAATELGLATVGVYTHLDRGSLHRIKAFEAYRIGPEDRPLAGYLDIDEIVGTALRVGADSIYPGYGFLSESVAFAAAVTEAGLTWIGPPPEVLDLTGDKVRARDAAAAAGLPVLAASAPVESGDAALAAAEEIGYPVFVKAAAGGGGRGLRMVTDAADLPAAIETARNEARSAFNDDTVFLEQALLRPRHIEVQVLGGADAQVTHLGERDCSIQRRHQKVLEIAPAPNCSDELRQRLHADAVRFADAVGYVNAGTVEFLLADDGRHYFIEMNPRIQVEHTVTEEITGVDLVQAQMRIAGGATLTDLGLQPGLDSGITPRGTALQCRITTEDPSNGFRSDTGEILAYRSAGGFGVRLDSGSAYVGSQITPYFDSMLVKVTCRGPDLGSAARRASRALAEFRIRGVASNISFLQAVLADPDFLAGRLSTAFIDEHPELTRAEAGQDRATRILRWLAHVTVNQPHGAPPTTVNPVDLLPPLPDRKDDEAPEGSRTRLLRLGPEGFAQDLRTQQAVAVTDTTLRDAHQSLLATRMRTFDMLAAARHIAAGLPQLLSLELWGGATYDVALRFLHEDPWARLAALREAMPDLCFQMLLRGRNLLAYNSFDDTVVKAFVEEAVAAGIDLFRIFDAFNDVDRMRPAVEAVRESGTALAEGCLCYTGDLCDPNERLYTLDHYLGVAEGLVEAGVHVLAIKDMAGLLRAPAASILVSALRQRFDLPVHLHTHDTGGGQLATLLSAIAAGVDAVDAASSPLAGGTSQPPLAALIAATDATPRATGLSLDAALDLEPYWEAVRSLYKPFDEGLPAPSGWVYRHQMPGGQLSNLRQQAAALGLGGRFAEVARTYQEVNALLGNLIKVTPSSKVVGDLALFLLSAGVTTADFEADPTRYDIPASVIAFLEGDLGEPVGGWPQPLRDRVLAKAAAQPKPGAATPPVDLEGVAPGPDRQHALSEILFPGPTKSHDEAAEDYGDLSVLPTPLFLYGLTPRQEVNVELEPGVQLLIELDAVTEPDADGERSVLVRLNGQVRAIDTRDEDIAVVEKRREAADPSNPGHVAAPLTGIVTIAVKAGDTVDAGAKVAVIEAMKMESTIAAPIAGRVARVVVDDGARVEPGDLLVVLEN